MPTPDTLLDDLFGGRHAALRAEFDGWLRGSRRLVAFADVYRGKIRAKLRHAADADGLRDVRAELETAALLLSDERFAVEYEKYAAAKQRGPDLTVTFRTHTPFNVEVRRLRAAESDADPEARAARLVYVLVDKVRQMPPSIVNLLWLSGDGPAAEDDLSAAATTLRQLAERKADDFFTRRGYESAADFQRAYARLSGVVWRGMGQPPVVWLTPLARHKAPPEIITAIRRLSI
jgi:hypothetical protein